MSPGEWIALCALLFSILGGVASLVFWIASRDAKLATAVQSNVELKAAIQLLTTALNDATTEMRQFQTKMDLFREHVQDQHEAIWNEIEKLRQHSQETASNSA